MKSTEFAGYTLYHNEVETLGPGVAENIVWLIGKYSQQTSLSNLPPISLLGPRWDAPWNEVKDHRGLFGNAGDQRWTYKSLSFEFGYETPREFIPRTPENVIAHELTHLRWKWLDHGAEFEARVWGLLHGAVFPRKHGRWSSECRELVETGRQAYAVWFKQTFPVAPILWKEPKEG